MLLPGIRPLSPPQEQLTKWLREEWSQLSDEQKVPYEQAAAAWTAKRVPLKQSRPQRSRFDSDESFATARKEHEHQMRVRRKAQERLREQVRPMRHRPGRDQRGRAHHSRDKQREQRSVEKAELKARRAAAHATATEARMHERAAIREENEIRRFDCRRLPRSEAAARENQAAMKRMQATEQRQRAWADAKQLRKRSKPNAETMCLAQKSRRLLPLVV